MTRPVFLGGFAMTISRERLEASGNSIAPVNSGALGLDGRNMRCKSSHQLASPSESGVEGSGPKEHTEEIRFRSAEGECLQSQHLQSRSYLMFPFFCRDWFDSEESMTPSIHPAHPSAFHRCHSVSSPVSGPVQRSERGDQSVWHPASGRHSLSQPVPSGEVWN